MLLLEGISNIPQSGLMAETADRFRSDGVLERWSVGYEKSSGSLVLFQYSLAQTWTANFRVLHGVVLYY